MTTVRIFGPAQLAREQNDLDQAQAFLEEALATAWDLEFRPFVVLCLTELGVTYYQQGDIEKYKQSFTESISLAKALRRYWKIYPLVSLLNSIPSQLPEGAAKLLGVIDVFQKEDEILTYPLVKRYCDQAETYSRNVLGDSAFESAFADGQKLSLEDALDLAVKALQEM